MSHASRPLVPSFPRPQQLQHCNQRSQMRSVMVGRQQRFPENGLSVAVRNRGV